MVVESHVSFFSSLLSHLAGQNSGGRPVDRCVPTSGEPYGGEGLHLQHLRSEASSTVGDVREKQRPSMPDGEEGIPDAEELHG